MSKLIKNTVKELHQGNIKSVVIDGISACQDANFIYHQGAATNHKWRDWGDRKSTRLNSSHAR